MHLPGAGEIVIVLLLIVAILVGRAKFSERMKDAGEDKRDFNLWL